MGAGVLRRCGSGVAHKVDAASGRAANQRIDRLLRGGHPALRKSEGRQTAAPRGACHVLACGSPGRHGPAGQRGRGLRRPDRALWRQQERGHHRSRSRWLRSKDADLSGSGRPRDGDRDLRRLDPPVWRPFRLACGGQRCARDDSPRRRSGKEGATRQGVGRLRHRCAALWQIARRTYCAGMRRKR